MTKKAHDILPLRTVSRMTGLTPDVIRAWERRYGVVDPKRGPRGARLYSADHVERLRLLRKVVASGRAIGDVARLNRDELVQLTGAEVREAAAKRVNGSPDDTLSRAIGALERFDGAELDQCLGNALIGLGAREFNRRVVHPLLEEVGDRWADGRLSVADEHLLSATLRNLLAGILRLRAPRAVPAILFATPAGERHEFGLLQCALMVAEAGLSLCYLGTDLPAAEISGAVRRAGVSVVGLGVANGDNQPQAIAEIRRLERELGSGTELWVGGRQAAAVVEQLGPSRAIVLDDADAVEDELERVRAATQRRE